ncbi:MAG: lysostaphin resistance A-like protein [Christensenellales bacterium]
MKFYTVEGKNKSIFKVYAIYYICISVFCVMRIITSLGIIPNGKLGDLIFSLILQLGVLFALPLFLSCKMLKVSPKKVFKDCNYEKINVSIVLISIVLGILCFFINIAVSSLFNGILSFSGYRFIYSSGGESDYSTANFFLQLFLVALLPAIGEEFLHRGIVLQGIKHMGFKKAIVISSLLFGLIHFNIQQVSYAFVIGLILGLVAVVSKNIYPAMIIHFVNNGIATYIDFASERGWVFGDVLDKTQSLLVSGNSVVIFIISCLVMLLVVALLCFFVWLLYKQSIIRKVNKALDKAYSNFSSTFSNSPIVIREQQVIKDLLENNTLLNLDHKIMDNPINLVMPKEKSRYKVKPMDNLFLWGSIIMGALITLFTYVWGLL